MGKFSAFKLPLKSLGIGTHNFEYHLDKLFFANMENPDIHGADLAVKLTVVYNGEFYALDFVISGEITLVCDRCLDDLYYPIDADYYIAVKYGEGYNDDNDEMLEIPSGDAFLNVAYMIYDTVVLAIPIKHVHPQGKCNRQMSAILKKHRATTGDEDGEFDSEFIDEMDSSDDTASAEAPTDPRWDALRKLSGDSTEE